jgi:hypothetical protein
MTTALAIAVPLVAVLSFALGWLAKHDRSYQLGYDHGRDMGHAGAYSDGYDQGRHDERLDQWNPDDGYADWKLHGDSEATS